VVDCNKVCTTDTTSDGSCDERFECLGADADGGDCLVGIGSECEAEDFGISYLGIFDCDMECGSSSRLGNGECNDNFDCSALDWDAGDCGSGIGVCEGG